LPIIDHQHRLGDTARAAGEQFERAALLWAELHKSGNSDRSGVGSFPAPRELAGLGILASNQPPFAIAPLDPVEKQGRLFARKHHADITGRNQCRLDGVKFVAFGKRRAFV